MGDDEEFWYEPDELGDLRIKHEHEHYGEVAVNPVAGLEDLQLPNPMLLLLVIALVMFVALIGRRVARRFGRRERETTERALWAMSGYYPTTRIFTKWRYGHKRRRRG